MGENVVFAVLWVVFSVLGEIGDRVIIRHNPMYYIVSNQGQLALQAFNFLMVVLTPIFVFVVLFLVFTMVRFTTKRGEMPPANKRFAIDNKAFVLVWVGGSIALNLLFFLHPTTSAMEQMFALDQPAANTHDLVVDVTARQWQWIFSYPQYGLTQTLTPNGQNLLELPVNVPVKFVLRSYDPYHTYDQYADVIHSFWVPAFGIKEDVIPGETRYEYLTPTAITSYAVNPMVRVQCAEVCGPGHPWMESPLAVVSDQQFAQWVKAQKALANG
ncbi:MAG: cytochrome C oxidase subunit II [Sulfobacillus thermosulfidooxidans]|nr:MAG: cytochrome C oxidase subunit II [Sulfobacillus thermosulfidooxidans]